MNRNEEWSALWIDQRSREPQGMLFTLPDERTCDGCEKPTRYEDGVMLGTPFDEQYTFLCAHCLDTQIDKDGR